MKRMYQMIPVILSVVFLFNWIPVKTYGASTTVPDALDILSLQYSTVEGKTLDTIDEHTASIQVTARLQNNTSNPQRAKLVVALYDGKTDTLKAINSQDSSNAIGAYSGKATITAAVTASQIEQAGIGDSDYIRVFVWDGFTNMKAKVPDIRFPQIQGKTTNNIQDAFAGGSNRIDTGRWSCLSFVSSTDLSDLTKGRMMAKGDGKDYAVDEWAEDLSNPSHTRYIKTNGEMATDHVPVGWCFTVSRYLAPYNLRIKGSYTIGEGGRFRILQTADTNTASLGSSYKTLLDYTGSAKAFDFVISASEGQDILFLGSNQRNPQDKAVLNITIEPVEAAFRNFMGACNTTDMEAAGSPKWTRYDFFWNSIEPQNGKFSGSALNWYKQLVLDAQKKGITVLPILCYSADWAANTNAYTYSYGGYNYEISAVEGTDADGNWLRTMTKKDSQGNVVLRQQKSYPKDKTPFVNVEDWKEYVEEVVSIFSQPPYNLKYFQVWNEAHPYSGFYNGGLDQYIANVHNPAAEIIRSHGGKVVYGGWPVCGQVSEYINMLTVNQVWDKVDVFDLHYFNIIDMNNVYNNALQHGISAPSVWQSEMGWTADKRYIPNTIPRMFYRALQLAGDNPDQFKQIYYTWWSPNDSNAYGYGNTLVSGSALSDHGKALKTLNELFLGGKVERYTDYTSVPALSYSIHSATDSLQLFKIDGKKIVVSADLMNKGATSALTVELHGISGVQSVERVDMLGNRLPLSWTDLGNGSIRVSAAAADTNSTVNALNGTQAHFYVVVNADQISETEN